ncbi:hypothetical protein TB9_01725 [Xanthomonas perforans]|uniref:Uncharacterized protein n=1 Tax=Xanthomonas perforans TaxID=442694 RepID=A0ABR5ETP7_XANPE|nr:hypothetical protein XP420_08250 [Xanthomonas perforans]TKA19044.1 hypothetical protein TP41_08285 [Xanthomonas euvesicatoria pv. citrumelonis]KLC07357.1 hypothetical protein XP315_05785 [Xanthomonas perforans]KLC13458.1 hypothetical protein XP4B_03615 [Xanthomonas perforans]KLC16628.1 hypothetical protein XP56_14100 [Xanthomonas perforans]
MFSCATGSAVLRCHSPRNAARGGCAIPTCTRVWAIARRYHAHHVLRACDVAVARRHRPARFAVRPAPQRPECESGACCRPAWRRARRRRAELTPAAVRMLSAPRGCGRVRRAWRGCWRRDS